jgi:hypothetical protein
MSEKTKNFLYALTACSIITLSVIMFVLHTNKFYTNKFNTISKTHISDSARIDSLENIIFELNIENGQKQMLIDNYEIYCKYHHIDAAKIEANIE